MPDAARRVSPQASGPFMLAGCCVEPANNRMSNGSQEVSVEPKIMDVLVALSSRPGEVFSRDDLIEKVWDAKPVSDEVVNRAIFELRKAFRELGVRREVIATVRKRGYRLTRNAQLAADSPRTKPALFRKTAMAVVGLITVAAAVFFWGAGKPPPRGVEMTEPVVVSLQPFGVEIENAQQRALAKVLSSSIADLLEAQPAALVRQVSSEHIVESTAPPAELKADFALEGLLGGTPEAPEIRARLLDQEGLRLWEETIPFESTSAGLEVASQRVAAAVSRNLPESIDAAGACPWVDDLSLLASYFEANRLISMRGGEPIREASEMLERIVERRPDFAQAWSALAWAYHLLPTYQGSSAETARTAAELTPLSHHAARRALELCENQAQAYLLVGEPIGYSGTHPLIGYDYMMRHALRLDPGSAEISRHYGDILYRWGRLEASRVRMMQALSMDPYNARTLREMAEQELDRGALQKAREYLEAAGRLGYSGPRYVWWRLAALSRDGAALVAEVPDELKTAAGQLAAALERPDDAELRRGAIEALEAIRVENGSKDSVVLAHYGGLWLSANDLAFDAWNDVYQRGTNFHSAWWPESAAFRADTRFDAFWKDFHLIEYWRHLGPPSRCELKADRLLCPPPTQSAPELRSLTKK